MPATKIKPKKKGAGDWRQNSLALREMLRGIPGFDPFEHAGDAWLDEQAARDAIAFFDECITHVEGELAGKPFVLERWQQAIVGNLWGWKRKDEAGREVRRFREVFIFVPRKNGKTPLAAGMALMVFFCDREHGQQDYIAAGNRDQASMLFRQAKGMVENEPLMKSRVKIYGGASAGGQSRSIVRESDASYLRVISADADSKHGGNTHLALVDELHVQPNRDLVDVLQTSMASRNRKQPLMIFITTADYDRPSICNEKYKYASNVRDGIIKDPQFLPVIYEATPEDDWKDEAVWAKANPNLNVSVSIEYLRRECKRAQDTPTYENTFRRLHLNQRTQNDVRWLQLADWDRGAATSKEDGPMEPADPVEWMAWAEKMLAGRDCFAGLDLSSRLDITAAVLVFPPSYGETGWYVLPRFWIPGENAERRSNRDKVPYVTWGAQGFINLTGGDVIDYDFVRASLVKDASQFRIREIAYDPWNATQMALQLQAEGATVVEFGQGFRSMSEPTKELETRVRSGQIRHGNNPVLRWMVGNCAVEADAAGNMKPSKAKSTERIDGVVGMIMAMGRAMVDPNWAAQNTGGNAGPVLTWV